MKKAETTWEVREKNYYRAGAWEWKTVKTFNSPKAADEWLTAYLKSSRAVCSDYTIRTAR